MSEPISNSESFLKLSPDKANNHEQNSSLRMDRSAGEEDEADGITRGKGLANGVRSVQSTQIPAPTVPSTAAVQRVAAANRANLVNGDSAVDLSREKAQRNGRSSPSWPTSPRLKSPPPSSIRTVSNKRSESGDHAQSNVSVKRLAASSTSELGTTNQGQSDTTKEPASPTTIRHTARGSSTHTKGLETVTESSVPTTPSIGPVLLSSQEEHVDSSTLEDETTPRPKPDVVAVLETPVKAGVEQQEGGSASAPTSRAASTSRPQGTSGLSKRSLTSLTGKKPAVEPMRSMTVETETVNSTPQLVVDRGRDVGSGVKAKPSTETIRPKKEKKKASRKAPSLHAGTGTSKADIFEAKVASAVDEADSSDSDETFVYESNPPEPRQSRHHSRTPSATSTTSQMDHYNRGKHGVRSGSAAIQGKKSMKFSNNTYGTHLDPESGSADVGRGSTRNGSSAHRHHHIGRHGRNTHTSIIDTDSPFSHEYRNSSPRTPIANGHRQSRPNSPRVSNARLGNGRKSVAGGYDTYDDGADDERAPLMGSVRVNRNRHSRRPNANFRSMEFAESPEPRCWPRYGGCVLLAVLVALVTVSITTFILALNRPLVEVELKSIHHVLASEQELMLDLRIHAMNPNLFTIIVNDLDVNLFAESPYAGTSQDPDNKDSSRRLSISERRQRQSSPQERDVSSWFPPFAPSDGVDEGNDPIDDPEPGTQKLLLGRISALDSPLMFDPSPIHHDSFSSDGSIRLAKPGNKTEVRGSERWERVIQHPFDLIVRGVLKYQLPFSSRNRSSKIGGRVKVLPGRDDDDGTNSTTILQTANHSVYKLLR